MDCKAVSSAWASYSWKKIQKSVAVGNSHWSLQAFMIDSINNIKRFSWRSASLRSCFSNSLRSHSWRATKFQSLRSSFCYSWRSCEWHLSTKNGRLSLRMFRSLWGTSAIFSKGFVCSSVSHCKRCGMLGKLERSSWPFPLEMILE